MAEQDNRTKSASQVNIDHFDPEGVRDLSRTLSQSSAKAKLKRVRSDKTLTPEEPFSLESALRAALDRYGIPLPRPPVADDIGFPMMEFFLRY